MNTIKSTLSIAFELFIIGLVLWALTAYAKFVVKIAGIVFNKFCEYVVNSSVAWGQKTAKNMNPKIRVIGLDN